MPISNHTTTQFPAIVVNPAIIERLVRKRTRADRPEKPLPHIRRRDRLPIEVQLGREHLAGLREEIHAAEDVLSNVYEDIDIFAVRDSALDEIVHLILRMQYSLDGIAISSSRRDAIKKELRALADRIDAIAVTSRHRAVPLLAPILRIMPQRESDSASGDLDVLFIIDRSRQMKKDVTEFVRHFHILHKTLSGHGLDVRYLLQTYEYDSQPVGEARRDAAQFIEDIETLYFAGMSKNALNAIIESSSDHAWRDSAAKAVVLFTASDTTDDYGETRDLAAARLRESGAVLYPVSTYAQLSRLPHGAFDQIATATGGRYINYDISPMDEVMTILGESIFDRFFSRSEHLYETNQRTVLIGSGQESAFSVEFPDFRASALGLKELQLETEQQYRDAIHRIETALLTISIDRAEKSSIMVNLRSILSHFENIRVFKLDFHV